MKVVKPFIKMKASSTETMQSMKKKKKTVITMNKEFFISSELHFYLEMVK